MIDIFGELKIQTIISPSTADSSVFSDVVREFRTLLKFSSFSSMFDTSLLFRKGDILFLETASATQKVSWSGLLSDPAVLQGLGLSAYCRNILNLLGQTDLVYLFDAVKDLAKFDPPDPTVGETVYSHSTIRDPEGLFAGKLSVKKEPAGKLRVFAMVTVWDQMVLKPIHDMLFAFLKGLPNDGTFNQHASEIRAREKSLLVGRSYGYDLSAATDRLPLSLQSMALNFILPDLGDNWALLLTRRDYYMYIPKELYPMYGIPKGNKQVLSLSERGGKVPNSISFEGIEVPVYYNSQGAAYIVVRYSVGQPMGALSSWAMLALTHHMIVQWAYRRAYNVPLSLKFTKDTWYTNYELLGDDIILFDDLVAKEYL